MQRFCDPTNDVAFRKIFCDEDRLRGFLNAILRRKGDEEIVKVTLLPTEIPPRAADKKGMRLDVSCVDHAGHQYIVEMQNQKLNDFFKRAQFYAASIYSGQLTRGDKYLELRPVILLSILNHSALDNDISCISYHHLLETETKKQFLRDISFVFVELDKFDKMEDELESEEDHWLYVLKNAREMVDVPSSVPDIVRGAYTTLEQFRWDNLERRAYLKAVMQRMDDADLLDTIERKRAETTEALEMAEKIRVETLEIVERSRAEALDKGLQEGLEKGREEGEKIGVKKIAKNLLAQGVSHDLIAATTGLSLEEIQKL